MSGAQHPRRPAGRVHVGVLPVRGQARRRSRRRVVGLRAVRVAPPAAPAMPATSMRSPYGGFTISVPGSSAGSGGDAAERVAAVEAAIASATPARSALRRAKSTMRNETSLPKIGTAARARAAAAFGFRRCQVGAHARRSRTAAGARRRSGAAARARCRRRSAPPRSRSCREPQHGSCSAPPSAACRASRRRRASPRPASPSAAHRPCPRASRA